jgi:hypothetical protein
MGSLRGDERMPGAVLLARMQRDTGQSVIDDGDVLLLWHHLTLHDWHLTPGSAPNERADRTARGYVAQHEGRLTLVNTSDTPWYVRGADGADTVVGRNQVVVVAPGVAIRVGDAMPARVLQFDALR